MSLMLSRHGIWYYRKVNLLPCGKRREFRRSLGTRSKSEAIKRVERFADRPWKAVDSASPSTPIQSVQQLLTLDQLKQHGKDYVAFKEHEVCEREAATIKRCLDKYFDFTDQPLQKSQSAKFIAQLTLSITTKNKYVKKIGGFFRWLNNRIDQDVKNPFDGLMQKDREAAASKRDAYTLGQIKQLERSIATLPEWKKWIILIGRYTGMRANEICQLYQSDIKKIDGAWCISIDDKQEHQVIKTDSSRRILPIHNELIAMGLLHYIDRQKGHLFPQLTLYKGYYSHYFTRWFSRFRVKHNIPEFHSLRHYVATAFKNAGVPEQYAGAFLGHSNASITYNRYGKVVDIRYLIELLKLI
ncbi:site-specific integrase [Citrobacter freundii]|nr:site-specific integrase [Citrobacter freundii]